MDSEVTLLREVASELRAVASLIVDRHGALPVAIRLANDPATWQGRFAEGFAEELRTHQGNLHRVEDGLTKLAWWLERVADERQTAQRMALPPGMPDAWQA